MNISDFTILYINLAHDTHKKELIEQKLNKLKLKYERVDAVYGKRLRDDDYCQEIAEKLGMTWKKLKSEYWLSRKNFKTMNTGCTNITLGRVGCYLSHILAMRTAIKKKLNGVIILEDDVDIPEDLRSEILYIPENADIFYLGGSFITRKMFAMVSEVMIDVEKLTEKYEDIPTIPISRDEIKIAGAYAYIIPTPEKIKDIDNVLSSVFIDGIGRDKHQDWRSGNIRMRAQALDYMYINIFQQFGKTYVANPTLVGHIDMGSNITNNRQKYKINHRLKSPTHY